MVGVLVTGVSVTGVSAVVVSGALFCGVGIEALELLELLFLCGVGVDVGVIFGVFGVDLDSVRPNLGVSSVVDGGFPIVGK